MLWRFLPTIVPTIDLASLSRCLNSRRYLICISGIIKLLLYKRYKDSRVWMSVWSCALLYPATLLFFFFYLGIIRDDGRRNGGRYGGRARERKLPHEEFISSRDPNGEVTVRVYTRVPFPLDKITLKRLSSFCRIPAWYFRNCKNSRRDSSRPSPREMSRTCDRFWRNIRISI